MKALIRLFGCIMMLGLVACTLMKHPLSKTQNVAQCKQACYERFKSCSKVCEASCPKCLKGSCLTAAKNYRNYVHEKIIQGDIIAREMKSYRDPLQCLKTTCNCTSDAYTCVEGCTGVIQKRLQPQTNCVPNF